MSRFRKLLRWAAVIGAIFGIGLLIRIGYGEKQTWTGFQDKTLWHWLELAVVPLSLALVAFLFNRASSNRDRQLASEREFYTLLATSLPRASSGAALRGFILSTLHISDPRGKAQLLRSLYEANLINGSTPVIDLRSADLRRADLHGMDLKGANLTGADLSEANVSDANLTEAILCDTNLMRARSQYGKVLLSGALLEKTDLRHARLPGANLCNAILACPKIEGTDFRGADLSGVKVVELAKFKGADLRRVRLHGAELAAASFEQVRWDASSCNDATQWPQGFPCPPECKNISGWWRAQGRDSGRGGTA